jgi:predicted molibdopterin-dependent oxidoreductase YjgC
MNIVINEREVAVREGETLIETARRNGLEIPSLCYAEQDAKHQSSCMVCAVRNCRTGQIIPSCTTLPVEGMQIDTESPEVITTRTLSLELLLSDHRADCEAPCRMACPGNMDVARMNRLYDRGRHEEALTLLRDTLVIPATLCYICNAPCEKICRKGDLNTFVPIREIKKTLVAKTDLSRIQRPESNGRQVAITGSDPAALAAAYHLRKQGYEVSVFEKSDALLTPYIQAEQAPAEIIGLEIEVMRRMGVRFILSQEAPPAGSFEQVITPQTKTKQPARMTLEGRILAGVEDGGKPFNSNYSRFTPSEKEALGGATEEQAGASGCLYCDCEGKTSCRLRRYATEYGVRNSRYTKSSAREALRRQQLSATMWFEPAKCIRCGLCVYNSANGFTFKDRGFVMQVVLPEENKANIREELAQLCPTGAIYNREEE